MELLGEDLLRLVLQQTVRTPADFVSVGRVCREWREICLCDETLVLTAVRGGQGRWREGRSDREMLTKQTLMGLLALSSREADALPREVKGRRGGGFMYLYEPRVAETAWKETVGEMGGWRERLSKRSREQLSVERAFGAEWRELQWPKRQGVVMCRAF